MTTTPTAVLVVVLILVAVLTVSGLAKRQDPRATRDAFVALRVPAVVPVDASATLLPWVEIGLAVLLLVAPAGWLVPVAAALLVLMLAYSALIARALGFESPVSCSCFGSLGRHDVDRTTLARNVLLVALAAIVLAFALEGGSTPGALADLGRDGWWTLLAVVAAVAVTVLISGPSPATSTDDDVELLDYERQPIPYGVLAFADRRSATLTELSLSQARLIVMLNPSCSPCLRTAEKLDAWARELAPAVGVIAAYPDAMSAAAQQQHAPELAAWEPDFNVRRLFPVGAPLAVVLGADGFLAGGPVGGEDAVDQLVGEIIESLAEQPAGTE